MSVSVDIEKRLGDFTLKAAFEAGNCVHGLLGASGCGKSLTLRCIAGVLRPDRGRIEVDGRTLFDSGAGLDLPPQKRRVGLLFQNYALFPNMTLEQNLLAVLRGKNAAERRGKVRDMLRRFHLEGLERHRPAQLSGGQQQRAALARILLTEPSALLLDEPFSALDSYLRWQTELELSELLDAFPGTTLLVTHSRDEVRRLCETVTVLDRGRAAGAVPVEELFRRPKTLAACLLSGCKNFSRARGRGGDTVFAEDWGAPLRLSAPVPERFAYVAVRAHHIEIAEGPGENVLPCGVSRVVRDLFSAIVMAGTPGGGRLRVELDLADWEQYAARGTLYLRLPPERLMPLEEEADGH